MVLTEIENIQGSYCSLSYIMLGIGFFGLDCYERVFWIGILAYFLVFLIGVFSASGEWIIL